MEGDQPLEQEHYTALQALQHLEQESHGLPVASLQAVGSNDVHVTSPQGEEVNASFDGEQSIADAEALSPDQSGLGKKRKKRDSNGNGSRRRKSNVHAANSQQLPFLIVPVTVPSPHTMGNMNTAPPTTNLSVNTSISTINPGGIVYPQNNMGPYGTILYRPSYPSTVNSQMPPSDPEQYTQFIQTQMQYLETIRLLREAHAARMHAATLTSSGAVASLQAGNSVNPLSSSSLSLGEESQHSQSQLTADTNQHPNVNVNVNVPTGVSLSSPVMVPNMRTFPGRFMLQEQPNPRQRKSYKNENRYLLPNPITVCAREVSPDEQLHNITEGKASIQLVNAAGEELPISKSTILECPDGGLNQVLDNSLKARFSLKVSETSEGGMFRLLITVDYRVDSMGTYQEKILSSPFQVSANIKKNSKASELPIVYDMKPKEGLCATETEVWIKGAGFNDRVVVAFGDKMGKIIEATENLITVMAPARPDFVTGTTVSVVVSNKYSNEMLSAEKLLAFVYL